MAAEWVQLVHLAAGSGDFNKIFKIFVMARRHQPTAGLFAILATASGLGAAFAPSIVDLVVPALDRGRSATSLGRPWTARPSAVETRSDGDLFNRFQFAASSAFEPAQSGGQTAQLDIRLNALVVADPEPIGAGALKETLAQARAQAVTKPAEDDVGAPASADSPDMAVQELQAPGRELPAAQPAADTVVEPVPVARSAASSMAPTPGPAIQPSAAILSEPQAQSPAPAPANVLSAPWRDRPEVVQTGALAADMQVELRRDAGETLRVGLPMSFGTKGDGASPSLLIVEDLPDGVTIAPGKSVGAGIWQTQSKDLNRVRLVIDPGAPAGFELGFALLRADGTEAEAMRVAFKIADQPAATSSAQDVKPDPIAKTQRQTARSNPVEVDDEPEPQAKQPTKPVAAKPVPPKAVTNRDRNRLGASPVAKPPAANVSKPSWSPDNILGWPQ